MAHQNQVSEEEQAYLLLVGQMYKTQREGLGLSQRAAAKLNKSSQARVSSIENGHTDVGLVALKRWAEVYGCYIEISLIPYELEQEDAT